MKQSWESEQLQEITSLDEDLPEVDEELERGLAMISASPTIFCDAILDFKPFPYQVKMLEDPSNQIVVCAARRVGKSLVMSAKALWFAFTHPRSSTLIVASTQRQSILMFDKLLEFIAGVDMLQQSVMRKTRTILNFTNGSRIVALPCGRSGRTLRGETADLIIVDEAAFVPEDVILSVLMPMLATTNGTMILLSTPYDKAHFFFRAFNTPNWSKYRFKTSDNPLVRKEYLETQHETLGDRRFRQEYEAEFVDDEKTYFPMELLRSCIHVCESIECSFCKALKGDLSHVGKELYGGYDPGGNKDMAALAVLYKVPGPLLTAKEGVFNPAFRVVYTKTFLAKKSEGGVVYTRFNAEIADLHKKHPLKKIYMDATGIGSPILTQCQSLGLPAEGVSLHARNKEELFANLRLLLETRKIELPDSMDLLTSLNCIEAERTATGGFSFSHPKGTHDDLAYALALAAWRAGRGEPKIIANFS
ncbi:MAG: phage terminase large subunit [Nitrososphaerales archaeon]